MTEHRRSLRDVDGSIQFAENLLRQSKNALGKLLVEDPDSPLKLELEEDVERDMKTLHRFMEERTSLLGNSGNG